MNTKSVRPILTAVSVLTAVLIASTAVAAPTPKVGDKAPLFTGKNQDGKTWKLASLIGKKNVLLYFYPKDETPGCTKEACSMRDGIEEFNKDNVAVVGVSFDSAKSHQQFIEHHKLNFPLLADTNGKISDAYGARRAPGANMDRRISFLIGLDGRIVHVTDSPNPDVHLKQMKEAIAGLEKS